MTIKRGRNYNECLIRGELFDEAFMRRFVGVEIHDDLGHNHLSMSTPQLEEEHSTATDREPWWRHVRDAIRGVHHDYTEGPIGRSLMLLAVPMVLETLMESLFAVVDVFFVAKLGADAVATVGLTESMIYIIFAVAMGLGIGAMAVVARRIGEHDPEGAAKSAVQAIM